MLHSIRPNVRKAIVLTLAAALPVLKTVSAQETTELRMEIDPVTRYVHVSYFVPADTPDAVVVRCMWSVAGAGKWQPAKIMPFLSETALNLIRREDWESWRREGKLIERGAAGLERTVVFNPYPEAQDDGRVAVDFKIDIQTMEGAPLASYQAHLQADNSNVVYLEDWSQVFQQDAISTEREPAGRQWSWRTNLDAAEGATLGNELYGNSPADSPLPQLSYPLDLKGEYAIFVCTAPDKGGILLRLTGDERMDQLSSRLSGEEVLWRWCAMDRQHLVLKQPHSYKGFSPAHVDYVKLVPLAAETAAALDAQFGGEPDRIVAGYWEPYSWAFSDDVLDTLQHRAQLTAFQEARIGIVDTQLGRFGMKSVYETRVTDQLLFSTIGDPVAGDAAPRTNNVGRMQQFTNTLNATVTYARELGLIAHANFGASNCYPGSPLQGDFSRAHPEWMRGSALRFEVPEVRQYALDLYREALEIGVPGVSIDFCRYPEAIDKVETANIFLRDLRQLADKFGRQQGRHIPILVRFPGTGVRRAEFFDFATWLREKWVDYLCPSNIQGRHLNIDPAPYLEAAKGTGGMVLPSVDALEWGLDMPGPFLWRVAQLYAAGVPGIHVYQADSRVLGRPADRRCMRMLADSRAVRRFWEEDARTRPRHSKGVYLSRPTHPGEEYNRWERLRVWVEGLPMGPLEMELDGQSITHVEGPPYLLGTEDYASDGVVPAGEHELRVRLKDGAGWFEQVFTIKGAG